MLQNGQKSYVKMLQVEEMLKFNTKIKIS